MKKILLILCASLFIVLSSAQSDMVADEDLSFGEGKSVISIGYGGPNQFITFIKAIDSKIYDINLTEFNLDGKGPFHLKYEYGLNKNLGLGLSINHSSASATYKGTNFGFYNNEHNYNAKISTTSVLLRINGHLPINKIVDPYIGFGVGYKGYSITVGTDNPDLDKQNYKLPVPFPFGAELTIGSRFYLTKNIGFYIEAGLAKSLIQGGLSVKF